MDLLNDKEREYLKIKIKDFRDYVCIRGIIKEEDKNSKFERLKLEIEILNRLILVYTPLFEKGKHFKALQLNKLYTLEELGL